MQIELRVVYQQINMFAALDHGSLDPSGLAIYIHDTAGPQAAGTDKGNVGVKAPQELGCVLPEDTSFVPIEFARTNYGRALRRSQCRGHGVAVRDDRQCFGSRTEEHTAE